MNHRACHSLIEDIVYHAIRDLRALNDDPDRVYVDDDHRALCNSWGFADGREELSTFFGSGWFSRLCDEFVDIGEHEILSNIDIHGEFT